MIEHNIGNNGPIGVLGAGSWGTALASVLASNQNTTLLWGRNEKHLADIASTRCNHRYLGDVALPDRLIPEPSLENLVKQCDRIVVVVPSHAFYDTLVAMRSYLPRDKTPVLIWGTKGFEPKTGRLLNEVVTDVLGRQTNRAIISGPSFAHEVVRCLPTALTVAANNKDIAETVANWFRNSQTRVYTNDDITGVQLGGAIKNVMAIATGISDGLQLGANARAALITRGLFELTRLGIALGGKRETFMGLTGVGDLILTCTDDQSRNRRVGLGVGSGITCAQVLEEIGQEAEGINTSKSLYKMSQRLGVDMPITRQVYKILFENLDPGEAVTALLSRAPQAE